jgi:hypothetical protein
MIHPGFRDKLLHHIHEVLVELTMFAFYLCSNKDSYFPDVFFSAVIHISARSAVMQRSSPGQTNGRSFEVMASTFVATISNLVTQGQDTILL